MNNSAFPADNGLNESVIFASLLFLSKIGKIGDTAGPPN